MESPNITGQYSSTHVVTYWQLTKLFTVVRAAPADQILTTHRTAPAWADIWCGHWIYSSQYEKTNTSFFNSLSPKNPQLSQCSWCRVAHGNFLSVWNEMVDALESEKMIFCGKQHPNFQVLKKLQSFLTLNWYWIMHLLVMVDDWYWIIY